MNMTNYSDALFQKLKGKKILFIGVKFYYFNEEIIKKMKHYGADVTFFYERDTSLKYGIIKNLSNKYADQLQDQHYRNILEKVKTVDFDFLFVIRGYKMEPWFISFLKERIPAMKTIMYQWDAYKNWDCDYRPLISSFDVVKTFDYLDAEELGLEYVPTFHTDEFKNLPQERPIYDLFYFGGYSYPRYQLLQDLLKYTNEKGYKLKTHLAISRLYYFKERVFGRKLDASILSFKKLPKNEYIHLFNQSLIIIDYTNEAQSGITMRTLDALGAGKKVLTSNAFIKREPDYDPKQVQVFDPRNIHINPDFVKYETFAPKDYSIERWLNQLF